MPLTQAAALRKDRTSGRIRLEHRHFATIASIITAMPDRLARRSTALHFASELRRTNPNFDQERFLRACEEER